MNKWRLLASLILFSAVNAFAQSHEKGAYYTSKIDQDLSIRYMSVLPISDNLGGIYSRPVEEKIKELVKENHHWDFRELNFVGPIPTLNELESSPDTVKKMTGSSPADAVIIAQILKGPKGISMRMNLFQTRNGMLLAQTILRNHKRNSIADIKTQTARLFRELVSKIPYQGLILSRKNNRVTINLGTRDGISASDSISAIQIIGVERHPKFNFLIKSHKEILGKIKILKVDDTLSFGTIIFEREKGALQKGTKLASQSRVNYSVPESLAAGTEDRQTTKKKLSDRVAFGKNASEWKPISPPTFGQVALKLGIGTFNGQTTLSSSGSLEATDGLVPQIGLSGELWVNPKWTVRFNWEQGIAGTENPVAGSSPENLSHSLSAFQLMIGYNFLLQQEFFGPKVEVSAGFSSYSDNVDDSSSPQGLTSMSYSGLTLGLRGSMPIDREGKWTGGIGLNMILGPSMKESPVTSGAESSASVNDFLIMGSYKYSVNMHIFSDLNFRLTRASFTGSGTRADGQTATSASQKVTTLSGGIIYMF